jgi:hypothetical protein
MCTLALAFRTDRRFPLVVAANRDESLARPSESWDVRAPASGPRFVAPRDLVQGGTWIGLSARGLFAAVTNVHVGAGPDPSRRSRGELVGRSLAYESAAEARTALARADAALYNPFHLVVADGEEAFLLRYDGAETWLHDLEPGLHIVTENAAEDRGARGELVRARFPLDLDPARLRALLALHGAGREGTCIHLEPRYGTRSSVILRRAVSLGASELLVADAPPCTAPHEDRSRLIEAIARSP